MKNLFENYTVKTYNTDHKNNLKLTDLFTFFQEIASNSANVLGFGYDDLIKDNQFWVLVRMKIIINEMPKLGDELKVETFPKGMNKVFALRDFFVYKNDIPIIKASSVWIILNGNTGRPVIPNFMREYSYDYEAIEGMISKTKTAPSFEKSHSKIVRYSDIDINNHMNNTKYIDSVLDAFDCDFFENRVIKEFQIDYLNQAKISDEMTILKSQIDENTFCIKSQINEKDVFISEIIFEEKSTF